MEDIQGSALVWGANLWLANPGMATRNVDELDTKSHNLLKVVGMTVVLSLCTDMPFSLIFSQVERCLILIAQSYF